MGSGGGEADASGANPRVSVVVPAYNRSEFVGATIAGILDQTFTDWELIVFDDGSSDSTFAVASSYTDDPRVSVIQGRNEGVAAARNRGFAAANPSTEYVIFVDHDDVLEPDAIDTLARILDENPDLVSAHGIARCIDSTGGPYPGDDLPELSRLRREMSDGRSVPVPTDRPTTFAQLVVHNWVLTPGTHLIRRSVLDKIGGFDAYVVPADDWDFAIRVSRVGDIGFVDRPLIQWRRHPGALSLNSTAWRQAYFRCLDKAVADPTNTREQTKAARGAYRLVAVFTLREAAQVRGRSAVASLKAVGKAAIVLTRFLAMTFRERLSALRSRSSSRANHQSAPR